MRHSKRIVTVSAAFLLFAAMGVTSAHAQKEDLSDGDKAYDRGDWDKAARSYDQAIRKWPSQVPPGAYAKRAGIFLIKKKYAEGLKFITQKAESVHKGAVEVLEQKAVLLWAMGSKPDAVRYAEEVTKKDGSRFSAQAIVGEFYAIRNPLRAITAYEGYFKHRPKELEKQDVLPRVRLGFAYLATGKARPKHYAEAEAQFDLLLTKHRKRRNAEVNAKNGLCAAYTAQGKYDRAITLCEKIITDPRKIDPNGSVWFNLGRAYLSKKQARRARTAGNEYIRMHKNKPKGYMLVGDAYFQDRDWAKALSYYLDAEKRARGNAELAANLGIKLGTTYRRMKRPKQAIAKLRDAIQVQPNNVLLATELGNAYLADSQDGKALGTVDRLIRGKDFATYSERERTMLLVIAGRAFYNQKKLAQARSRYEQAYKLRSRDIKIRIGLVQTINYQAYQSFSAGKTQAAIAHLSAAQKYNSSDALTNQNLAVVAMSSGRCAQAKGYLRALKSARGFALMYHRLMARAHLCTSPANESAAMAEYALAEKEALDPQVQANLVRAEIYTEWAPLIVKQGPEDAKRLEDAIEKLQTAVQFAASNPEINNAAKRNLALALFRRGWLRMRANQPGNAIADFEVASRDPRLLRGTEALAFDFSLAMAYLEKGTTGRASKLFKLLAKRGNQGSYLKAPYDKIGTQFFSSLAKYRSGNTAQRQQAAGEFARQLPSARGKFADQLRSLLSSSWQFVAFDAYRAGNTRTAGKALANVSRYATDAADRRFVSHNKAVVSMGSKASAAAERNFAALGATPPEAIANLGVMLDRAGKNREAYDAWVRARAKGVRNSQVNAWIAAKKRIFGY